MPKEQEPIQRWVTLDALCTILRLPKGCVVSLVERGCLVALWGKGSSKYNNARFLEPTEEYKQQLRLGAMIHAKLHPTPRDISELALLTVREVATIMGWKMRYAQNYMNENKVPYIKSGHQHHLYTSQTVRELLWNRQGRKTAGRRSHFLITELIESFQKWYAEDLKDVPTDAQFLADDEIQRKLLRIVEMQQEGQFAAQADFAQKVKLAKQIVQILKDATSVPDR
jgi:hypothetical protein